MIKVTKLNKEILYLNPSGIDYMESTPDTAIVMHNGKRWIVREALDDVVKNVMKYQKWVGTSSASNTATRTEGTGG